MPTLLQVNTTLNSGSTGRISEQISLLAEKKGWQCYIAHGGRYVNRSQLPTIQVSSKIDNIVHAIKGEFWGLRGFGSILSTRKFIRQLDKLKPDIVHLHNIHGYYINIEILLLYLAEKNISIVWTLHDCWSFTGHCTHFEKQGCNKWKTECGHCPLLMNQYKSRVFDRTRDNFRKKRELYSKLKNLTVVPVSNWLGNLVSQSILGMHKIKVINNGIDLDIFRPTNNSIRQNLGIKDNIKIILGVSSDFGPEKGKKEFIELSKNPRYQIIMVGLANKNNIPENIICISRTNSQKELAEYYSAADIFLNPTYNDTFPTTNIEAIACGTPVVTYRTGGSPEIIDAETGLVVERGDFHAMSCAIEKMLEKGKNYYSEACRNRAVRLYDKNERFLDYIKLYDEILKANSKRNSVGLESPYIDMGMQYEF